MSGQFIPAGRTSVAKRGKTEFQLQTEYARFPRPRITTTIFSEGQVLHKVERSLDREIETVEQMHQVEDIIKSQHLDISKVLREQGLPTVPPPQPDTARSKLRSERIKALDEVERVFLVTSDGRFIGDHETPREFQKKFKHIFKALPELMNVFAALPGTGQRREEGIYEIEPGRILMASTGVEFYLVLIKKGAPHEHIPAAIAAILRGE